jgi:hypothetical protein
VECKICVYETIYITIKLGHYRKIREEKIYLYHKLHRYVAGKYRIKKALILKMKALL